MRVKYVGVSEGLGEMERGEGWEEGRVKGG